MAIVYRGPGPRFHATLICGGASYVHRTPKGMKLTLRMKVAGASIWLESWAMSENVGWGSFTNYAMTVFRAAVAVGPCVVVARAARGEASELSMWAQNATPC
eukprot:scaffold103918_cov33-Tisochrysis_lutea.AAC.3